jgi:hypothetical protein
MLISLNGVYYHYCEIDSATLEALMSADSMGRYHNASIKGRFEMANCRRAICKWRLYDFHIPQQLHEPIARAWHQKNTEEGGRATRPRAGAIGPLAPEPRKSQNHWVWA